jgi:tellurite methyltransferase
MSEEARRRWEERYTAGHGSAVEPPSDFLAAHAELIQGRVLDVAAGGGRNALFLARRGCTVEAFDIAFAGLHRLREAARAERLAVRPVQADLEAYPLPVARYAAAVNIRYLQRSLFTPLQRAVHAGGLIVFETFLIDQRAIGHPRNPAYLLERGELRAAFAQCELLVYEEGLFEHAYLARMIARRRQRD